MKVNDYVYVANKDNKAHYQCEGTIVGVEDNIARIEIPGYFIHVPLKHLKIIEKVNPNDPSNY